MTRLYLRTKPKHNVNRQIRLSAISSFMVLSTILLVNLFLAHSSKYKALCYTIYSKQEDIAAVTSQQTGPFNEIHSKLFEKDPAEKNSMRCSVFGFCVEHVPVPLLSREPP